MLHQFYSRRGFRPAWNETAEHGNQIDELISMIHEADLEGLNVDYYHLDLITDVRKEIKEDRTISPTRREQLQVELDFLLTDAFLLLSCHFSSGCANPVMTEVEWFAKTGRVDVISLLEQALLTDSIQQTLHGLKPRQQFYHNLRLALLEHRQIASMGGWGEVQSGSLLKEGATDSRVYQLKKRLLQSGDLLFLDDSTRYFFDTATHYAVIKFQKRHGLQTDGIVGPQTLAALNIPVEKRIRQIELNLERLRWSFRNLGNRYLMVNIADFKLDAVENDRIVWSMRVVTGKQYWHTPVFSSTMKYLVFNPSWNVPDSIAVDEILPKIRRQPDYLELNNFSVVRGWGKNEKTVQPETINWAKLKKENFPFRFRQLPGPLNPLGRIKFMFPNKYNVYLHDTPNKNLFSKNVRMFSHGCIRVEEPVKLAAYLLQSDEKLGQEELIDIIEKGKETEIPLPQHVDIHIFYLTAWVDSNNHVQFRNDIYGRDLKMEQVLQKKILVSNAPIN